MLGMNLIPGEGQLAKVVFKVGEKQAVKKVAEKSLSKTLTKDVAKACNCFIAGTKVLTDEGEKNIEDIVVGDKVLSKDEATGEVAYKEVTATFTMRRMRFTRFMWAARRLNRPITIRSM